MKYLFAKFKHAPWWTKLSIILLIAILTTLWYGTYIYTSYYRQHARLNSMGAYTIDDLPIQSFIVDAYLGNQTSTVINAQTTLLDEINYIWQHHNLPVTSLSINNLNNLHKLKQFKNLKRLAIVAPKYKSQGSLTAISDLKQLEELLLDVTSLSDKEWHAITTLPNLKTIYAYNESYTNEQHTILSTIKADIASIAHLDQFLRSTIKSKTNQHQIKFPPPNNTP